MQVAKDLASGGPKPFSVLAGLNDLSGPKRA